METWAFGNLMKLKRGKWEGIPFIWEGTTPGTLEADQLKKQPDRKVQGVLVDHKSVICPCSKEGQHFSGVRWSFSFTQTCSGASELLDSLLGSSVEGKQGHGGICPLRAHKGNSGIVILSYKEKLRARMAWPTQEGWVRFYLWIYKYTWW